MIVSVPLGLKPLLRLTAAKDLDFRPYTEHRYFAPGFADRDVTDLPLAIFRNGEFDAEGWSPWFGYGLVDALKAVNFALSMAERL
jgi:hypothetical protein